MAAKEFLYCYKMTHDTGFAPNPYHGVLTLATCKPKIRKNAKKGYWISGWTSNNVQGKSDKFKFKDDNQKLIYLAKVFDNPKIEDYWKEYKQKRQPDQMGKDEKGGCNSCGNTIISQDCNIEYFGDNIYEPDASELLGFKQHKNAHHGEENIKRDLSGERVLVCKEFYYFGVEHPIDVKEKTTVVHRCQKLPLDSEEAKNVIEFVTKNYSKGRNPKKI